MWLIIKPASERRVALIVVAVFLATGSAWILATDVLLYAVVKDQVLIARIETAKGWAFVGLAALLVYAVTARSAGRLATACRTLTAVVESIGDGVLLLGTDRKIVYANPAGTKMLGTSLDDLRGMGAHEFSRRFHVSYPDGRLVRPDQFVSQRVFDEAGPLHYKAVLRTSSEGEVVMLCTAAAVRSELEERPAIVVSVMHDITTADQLERLRDELYTAAAHAIKTPVAVMKSAAQVLLAGGRMKTRRAAEMVERQCTRIDSLVDNLLVLSRIRSGTLQLHPVELELAPLVESVVRNIDSRSEAAGVQISLDAHPKVFGDRERLMMILRNVIEAAIRSSRSGEQVTVRVDRLSEDAEIEVSYDPQSFEHDIHQEPRPETEFDDMGVGRYVTQMMVEAHGGSFTEQADAERARIQIRLPALAETGV